MQFLLNIEVGSLLKPIEELLLSQKVFCQLVETLDQYNFLSLVQFLVQEEEEEEDTLRYRNITFMY